MSTTDERLAEIATLFAVGVALAILILVTSNAQREDLRELRREVHTVSGHVARLEGVVSGVLAAHRMWSTYPELRPTGRYGFSDL